MKIKIGFSRPRKWKPFAALIMCAYGCPFSHVYLKLRAEKYDRDLIYQASGTMVNFMSPDVFLDHNEIVREFELDVVSGKYLELVQFCIDNAGKPYSFKEVCGLAWVRLMEIFGKKVENPLGGGTQNYVCSVLADYVIDNFTAVKSPGEFENMSPLDVWNFLVALEATSSRV